MFIREDNKMRYGIDLEKKADELEFDIEEVEMLLSLFYNSSKKSLFLLKEAVGESDFDKIALYSHAIKGSSGNLMLNDIYNLSKEIEQSAKSKLDIDYMSKYMELSSMVNEIIL
jgi:HPt (histidine-containing phosphotransfer) domain-containing protein